MFGIMKNLINIINFQIIKKIHYLVIAILISVLLSKTSTAYFYSINTGCKENINPINGGTVYNQLGVGENNKIQTGSLIQYVYSGTNNIIDSIDPITGALTGDDILLATKAVGTDEVLGTFKSQDGYFYHSISGEIASNSPKIYLRIWDSYSIDNSNFYGESPLLIPPTGSTIPPIPTDNNLQNITIDKIFRAKISELSVEKMNDSDVRISWKSYPESQKVDIWSCADQFTTNVSSWIKEKSNIESTSWTDKNQASQGIQKYYKVLIAGEVLSSKKLEETAVGKYNISLLPGPSCNIFSLPLNPIDTNIIRVIGNNFSDGTTVMLWDGINRYSSYLNSGSWEGNLLSLEPNKGYFINLPSGSSAKTITFLGFVSQKIEPKIAIVKSKDNNSIIRTFSMGIPITNLTIAKWLNSEGEQKPGHIFYWNNMEWVQTFLRSCGFFVGTPTRFDPSKASHIYQNALLARPSPDEWLFLKPIKK